jgi:hypothetical protein
MNFIGFDLLNDILQDYSDKSVRLPSHERMPQPGTASVPGNRPFCAIEGQPLDADSAHSAVCEVAVDSGAADHILYVPAAWQSTTYLLKLPTNIEFGAHVHADFF